MTVTTSACADRNRFAELCSLKISFEGRYRTLPCCERSFSTHFFCLLAACTLDSRDGALSSAEGEGAVAAVSDCLLVAVASTWSVDSAATAEVLRRTLSGRTRATLVDYPPQSTLSFRSYVRTDCPGLPLLPPFGGVLLSVFPPSLSVAHRQSDKPRSFLPACLRDRLCLLRIPAELAINKVFGLRSSVKRGPRRRAARTASSPRTKIERA